MTFELPKYEERIAYAHEVIMSFSLARPKLGQVLEQDIEGLPDPKYGYRVVLFLGHHAKGRRFLVLDVPQEVADEVRNLPTKLRARVAWREQI